MYIKCLLLLFVFSQIEAELRSWRRSSQDSCPSPKFEHGRIKRMQRGRLLRFTCYLGYQLVGNKYATCSFSKWDVPIPVCVKSGCSLPKIQNSITFTRHHDAWIEVFCSPEHELVGSAILFCDGRKWNGTAPSCVSSKVPTPLSCDFEESDMCGWMQDELHDFDWKRLNGKTPSSFLFTGPSFDHTFGNASGNYMYIESTSRLENDTARLISPIYEGNLAKNGCFSFYYHMFGLTTGGLRIYQKPDTMSMETILALPASVKQKYILFEKWGNQGDFWYRGVSQLNSSMDNFQIIIEGIRGTSFTSDIAIDDVAILQGENCTVAKTSVSTPATFVPDSCSGRCDIDGVPARELGCGCTASCLPDGNCCPDFFEICVFSYSTDTDNSTDAGELPQTQKLVASTTPLDTTTTATTTTTNTTTTPKPLITTVKSTTRTTSKTTRPVSTKIIPTVNANVTKPPVYKNTTNIYSSTEKYQYKSRTEVFKSTTKKTVTTTHAQTHTSAVPMRTTAVSKMMSVVPVKTPVVPVRTTVVPMKITAVPVKTKAGDDVRKAQKEQFIQKKPPKEIKNEPKSTSGLKTGLITSAALLLVLAGAVWLIVSARSVRGRISLARMRGHATRDPEVRFLNADFDDE